MTWEPPTPRALREAGARLGLQITSEEAEAFARVAAGLAPAHDRAAAAWGEQLQPLQEPPRWRPGTDPWNATAYEITGLPRVPADGSLSGLRLAVKSTVSVAGVPLAAGSPLVAGYVPTSHATVVSRALQAGAAITHTGRTDDLCLSLSGTTAYDGPVLNPWSPHHHSTWGSSAGAAALVAASLVDGAILVDQAGSGRAPAAGCGLVALMPTRGEIPTTGTIGFTPVQDRIVVASRSTRTVAAMAAALSGPDESDLLSAGRRQLFARGRYAAVRPEQVEGMRVGLVTESLTREHCTPQVADAVHRRAEDLRKLGASVRPVSVPGYADTAAVAMLITLYAGVPAMLTGNLGSSPTQLHGDPGLARQVGHRRTAGPGDLAETVQFLAAVGAADTAPAGWWQAIAQALISQRRAAYLKALETVDVLLTPTVPSIPPRLPAPPWEGTAERLTTALSGITHTSHNITGLPAIQIPAGTVAGLPVGAQLIARPGREDRLLAASAALEDHQGGFPAAPTPHHAVRRGGGDA